MKVYLATFNRASDGALSKLKQKLIDNNFYTDDYKDADYVIACGDRKETFDFVLERFRENKKIIHLWAGEISQGTHDEVYRHSITLMSCIQLCTNDEAKRRVKQLCRAVSKKYLVITVGNIMLDNMEIDESMAPKEKYDLILYNPITTSKEKTLEDIESIQNQFKGLKEARRLQIWLEPNGDVYSDLISPYVTQKTLPRALFLGLLKNCERFITNSSCQYYEAPYLISKDKIISIGERNSNRESKYSNMSISNASENIIKVLRSLK
jgi:UDP-N-acetylglucosamine 2-epimerase